MSSGLGHDKGGKMSKLLSIMMLLALVFTPCLFSQGRVGEEVVQKFETPHPYSGKGVVWEQEFFIPEAGYIAVHFSQFDLAEGDYVLISSPDGQFQYMYRGKGKEINDTRGGRRQIGEFWATHIPGDRAVITLISKGDKGGFGFIIDKWVRGYEPAVIQSILSGMKEDYGSIEAICSADDKEWAKCYQGTAIYDKSKAVCRLLINGNTACTGWLLGSQGHVMTNNHCIETQSDADNTDFEFMAEGALCTTSCSSWGACPGTVAAGSGTLVKTNVGLDYSLVLLPTNVSGTYGYLQLRNTLPTVGERIYVPQHPSAYGKQLAVNSDADGGYAKIYSTNQSPCKGGPGDIGYYADTAGGSSGSPVIAYTDNLVVALHHCANCPNRGVPIPSIITDLGSSLPANAVSGGSTPIQYCESMGKNQNYEWISRVQVGNLDNTSGASAYSDYTNKKVTLTKSGSTSVTLTPAYASRSYTEYWKIWIDYNGDGDFADTGEEVFAKSGVSAVTGSFTVPASPAASQTRMRVSMKFSASASYCETFTYGEVEDYGVIIQ